MLVKVLNVKLNEEDTLKVSIFRTLLGTQEVYFARYININIGVYKDLSSEEQRASYGIIYKEYTNGPTVYYANLKEFANDLPFALANGPRLKSKK